MNSLEPELHKIDEILKQSSVIEDGNPARYRLKPKTVTPDESEPYRKMAFGERDKNKPHKTILMVGETGTGKTELMNTMINYILGVKREDKVWFEITDDQSDRTSVYSETSRITVYGFYLQESPIHLTIIDTPGYEDTRGVDLDKQIAVSLLTLCRCDDWIDGIHAVCLVIKATVNRLSKRQIYIFDAVQSLFGIDFADNIVLLFTYSDGMPPKDALKAVKEAKIKCAVNDKNQPVFFLFNNRQSDTTDEEYEITQEFAWNLSFRGMKGFFMFLDQIRPRCLKTIQDVLEKRKQMEANISNLKSQDKMAGLKQNELKQTQETLEKTKEYVKDNKDFEYEVDVSYKERVDINPSLASVALCCTVCEENCHYPGCRWFTLLSWCSVIKDDHCIVCTNKCHYSEHVKGAKIYETKTKKEKRTHEVLKKEYDGKIGDGESLVKKLEEELKELEKEKMRLLLEAFHCVETLEMIALKTDSLITLEHIDFLSEKMKEMNQPEKAKTLKNIREEKIRALEYIKKIDINKHQP